MDHPVKPFYGARPYLGIDIETTCVAPNGYSLDDTGACPKLIPHYYHVPDRN